MTDSQQSTGPRTSNERALMAQLRRRFKIPSVTVTRELIILFAVSFFTALSGLAPVSGGAKLGPAGADEPRYAQIAREMLAAPSQACHEVNAKMVPRGLHWTDLRNSY